MASSRSQPFAVGSLPLRAGLLGLALLATLGVTAPVAQAQPLPPVLTATTPASPGTLTTLRLLGREDGVGTSGTTIGMRAVGTAAIDVESPVSIYTDPACAPDSLVETGTLGELETVGIEVTVAPESTTTFYATLTDEAEPGAPSACSAGIVYRHVSGPPPVPEVTGIAPASPADDNAPRVSGSAEADASVAIYADAACAGPALAAGSAELFESDGVPVPVADNTVTTFHATAVWAGLPSPCSSTSVTFQEVTGGPPAGGDPSPGAPGDVSPAAPVPVVVPIPGRPVPPRLHTEPGGRANNTTPRVAGSAPGAVRVAVFATESCDGGAVANVSTSEFSAGLPVRVGANTTTAFSAVSIAADGDRSRCSPEPAVYVEDSLPPLTRITFGPGVKTRKRAPVFRFADLTGDPPGTVFLCKLDRRPWRPCQSPWRLKRVRPKKHVVKIRAIDAAGNQEPAAAKRSFKVLPRRSR